MEETPPPLQAGSKPHLEKLTLGVTRILESSPGVTEVSIIEKLPAERHMISSWEQKNNCVMPEDVRNFYLMTNGFHMTWSVKLDEQIIPLGSMVINGISKLTQLIQSSMYSLPNSPTLADLEDDIQEDNEDQPEKPHFDNRSAIFELDSCNGNGKVCLVYKNGKPGLAHATEIWFLDRALYWHFLTDTFTAYYRLLITHLGLPQWQYAFTRYGISPQAKQWFSMYKPITYNTNLLTEEPDAFVNKLDPSKVFKSKNKILIPKKKGPVQPATGQKGLGPCLLLQLSLLQALETLSENKHSINLTVVIADAQMPWGGLTLKHFVTVDILLSDQSLGPLLPQSFGRSWEDRTEFSPRVLSSVVCANPVSKTS